MLRVWVDSWQMQCCGDAFGVGDLVRWTLVPNDDATEPEDESLRTTHREEHHGGAPEDALETSGTVLRVRAVFSEYAPDNPAEPRLLSRVPGTATAHERRRVDGWEPESAAEDGPRFDGYVVDLDVTSPQV